MELWKEFFPNLNDPSFTQKNARITNAGIYFVNFAQFHGLGSEGVIVLSGNPSTALLVFASSFKDSFKSSGQGGSINLIQGSIVQYHICSTGCHDNPSTGWGGHSYTEVTKTPNTPNYLIESTISRCETSSRAFEHDFGSILVQSTNTSHYKGSDMAAFCLSRANNTGEVKYSLIVNNSCHNPCVGYSRSNYISIYCQFIENSNSETSYGIIHVQIGSSASFSNCSFVKNAGSRLFSLYESSASITNCFIKNPNCPTGSGSIGSTYPDQLEIVLLLLSTNQCNANNKLMNPIIVVKPSYITKYIPYLTLDLLIVPTQILFVI